MEKIVILGLGVRSTLFYQTKLHRLYFEIKGIYATFPFVVKQLDFHLINPYLPNNKSVISPILKRELKQYDVAGVYLLVPNITIHQILDTIDFQLQIIHPYKLLIKALADKKGKKLVLFGTKFTNNSPYLASFITENSIKNVRIEDVLFLDELRKKVYAYAETNQDIITYNKLIGTYSQNHIVVIACTELSIINSSTDNNIIDLSTLQCNESLQLILT
jgi:aspartate racemase